MCECMKYVNIQRRLRKCYIAGREKCKFQKNLEIIFTLYSVATHTHTYLIIHFWDWQWMIETLKAGHCMFKLFCL